MIGRAEGSVVAFKPGAILVTPGSTGADQFQMAFAGAQASIPHGEALQKSQTNYLIGNDAHWRTHVANYARVNYPGIYPGIDAVFYGTGHAIEHDFRVSPTADYRQIHLHFSQNAHASLQSDGSLRIALAQGSVQIKKPFVYQEQAGVKRQRRGSFRVLPNGEVGFDVQGYDPRYTLVIDPVLSFSTYLSALAPAASLIATDASGASYISGYASLGFPVTPNAFTSCSTCTTSQVVTYVSKLSADGTSLLYSTVLGGNSSAQPEGMAVDAAGDVILTGFTSATDFPTRNPEPIAPLNNASAGFLLSLSPDGSALNYGTLLGTSPSFGQSSSTYALAVAVDASGNAYVTGTTGPGFAITAGALDQETSGQSGVFNQFNVFLQKVNPTGNLLYSAILGTADPQNGGGGPIGSYAITLDAVGDAFVAGQAGTLWPISSSAYLKQIAGTMPYATPFVTEVAPDAKSLIYSTFLDYAYAVSGIAVKSNGDALVTGNEVGAAFPTTPNAFQANTGGNSAFLTELNSSGSGLVYSTVIGDSHFFVNGLALDAEATSGSQPNLRTRRSRWFSRYRMSSRTASLPISLAPLCTSLTPRARR